MTQTRPPSGRPSETTARTGGRAAQRRAQAQADAQADARRRELRRLGLVAVAAVLVAGGLALLTNLGASNPFAGRSQLNYPVQGTAKGDPNAPLTITTWDDFQ